MDIGTSCSIMSLIKKGGLGMEEMKGILVIQGQGFGGIVPPRVIVMVVVIEVLSLLRSFPFN